MTRAALDDVIAEARWVVENPSPRNVADLKAALESLDGARNDDEEIPGRDPLGAWDETPEVDPPSNPINQTNEE